MKHFAKTDACSTSMSFYVWMNMERLINSVTQQSQTAFSILHWGTGSGTGEMKICFVCSKSNRRPVILEVRLSEPKHSEEGSFPTFSFSTGGLPLFCQSYLWGKFPLYVNNNFSFFDLGPGLRFIVLFSYTFWWEVVWMSASRTTSNCRNVVLLCISIKHCFFFTTNIIS